MIVSSIQNLSFYELFDIIFRTPITCSMHLPNAFKTITACLQIKIAKTSVQTTCQTEGICYTICLHNPYQFVWNLRRCVGKRFERQPSFLKSYFLEQTCLWKAMEVTERDILVVRKLSRLRTYLRSEIWEWMSNFVSQNCIIGGRTF